MNLSLTTVYIGLGGNTGDCISLLNQSLVELKKIKEIYNVKHSSFFVTSPVECEGNDFLNAVCRFQTSLTPSLLFIELQKIEKLLGKVFKPKNAARPIDIDLLFFGSMYYEDHELIIPHPRWSSRLFVLTPLSQLTRTIELRSINKVEKFILKDLISNLQSTSEQRISLLA